MLPNLHKQVSGGKLRYLRTQVSDRPRAKEPAPLGFWGGEGSPGGGWGGGVGFAFAARAGRDGCPSRALGVPPAPRCPSRAPGVSPAPQCPSCAPGVPASPAPLLRPDFIPARARTRTRGPGLRDPPRRACPREAQSRVGGLAPTRSYLERSPRREALRGSGLLSGTVEAEAARDTGGVVRGAGRQGQEGQAPETPHPGSPGTRRARS